MNPENDIEAQYVIEALREQLSAAHWRMAILTAQLRACQEAQRQPPAAPAPSED